MSDYHIHSLSSTNDLSNSPTDSPYSDDYASTYPGGCFQTPYYNISYDVVTTSTGKVNQKFGIHLDTSTDASGDWWRCDYCGQGIGQRHVKPDESLWHTHEVDGDTTVTTRESAWTTNAHEFDGKNPSIDETRYIRSCGIPAGQLMYSHLTHAH